MIIVIILFNVVNSAVLTLEVVYECHNERASVKRNIGLNRFQKNLDL